MARTIGKLTALTVERAKQGNLPSGMYADGDGVYLQIKNGGISWLLRYKLNGRTRYMGLGPLSLFGLTDARARALDAKRLKHGGTDPIEAKRQERERSRLEAAKAITFKAACEAYIKSHKSGWRNEKHGDQWTNTLATYVEPIIGAFPVQAIDTALVMKVLEQEVKDAAGKLVGSLWEKRSETASRVRGRIEAVLDWAKVRGYREGENPARWRGHLDHLLPARGKVRRVEHHAALPYAEIGDFIVVLREQGGVAARALEFAILTAARTGEVIGARWSEIDLAENVWTVPAERMKAGKEHRTPLAPRAVAILTAMRKLVDGEPAPDGFVFPGAKAEMPLSNMAFLMLLRRMGRDDLTAHGFRSTFRDWAAERTSYSTEVAEMALAHTVSDKVEAAYRRGDLFEKRRRLMDTWATFCATRKQVAHGNVASMRQAS